MRKLREAVFSELSSVALTECPQGWEAAIGFCIDTGSPGLEMASSAKSVPPFVKTHRAMALPGSRMDPNQGAADVETLARMAARLAGRDPDEPIEVRVGGIVAFEGVAWRYPDFVARAEAAYRLLRSGVGF